MSAFQKPEHREMTPVHDKPLVLVQEASGGLVSSFTLLCVNSASAERTKGLGKVLMSLIPPAITVFARVLS